MSDVVLEARGLTAGYHGAAAVREVDLEVRSGEVVSILGPNGAGKTTTLLALVGLVPLMSGSVAVMGDEDAVKKPFRLARRGVALIPDDRGIFFGLTVKEHLRLSRRSSGTEREALVFDAFPVLADLRGRKAGLLSGGEQQMLAIGAALMAEPSILLVDEMSLGLAPRIVHEMLPTLRQLAIAESIAMVLVEQHVDLALSVSDHALVLNHGVVVERGRAQELVDDRGRLEAAYFGHAAREAS